MSGDVVNVVERQVLVLKCVVVMALQLTQQVTDRRVRRGLRPDRHGVDQQTHHRLCAGQIGRPPRYRGAERDVALTGHPHEQLGPRRLQHRVDGGVL